MKNSLDELRISRTELYGRPSVSSARRFVVKLEDDLFGNTTTGTKEKTTRDIIADIERIQKAISKPVPVGVWFIDRMSAFYRFQSMCKPYADSHDMQFHQLPFAGMPIYCWELCDLLEHIESSRTESLEQFGMTVDQIDDVHRRVFPIREVGVWLVWSTGEVQRIVIGGENENPPS